MRIPLLLATLLCIITAHTAHAVPLSDLTTTESITDGTFTYSNWTTQLSISGLSSERFGHHVTLSSVDDIDVQVANGSLKLTGITATGTNLGPPP